MSVKPPPNPNVNTFNNLYWLPAVSAETRAELDLYYLKFPISQGTPETLTNVSTINKINVGGIGDLSTSGSVVVGLGNMNESNTGTSNNFIFSLDSLKFATTAADNMVFGYGLQNTTSACCNVAIGNLVLLQNTTGVSNIGIGYSALNGSNGSSNVAIGDRALWLLTSGDNNVCIGRTSGTFATGSYNSCYGFGSNTSNSLSYATAIGAMSSCSTSNTIALGRSSGADNVKIYKDIVLQTLQPTNTDGYLGYTNKVIANVSGTLSSGVLFNMTSGVGLGVINPGVYIFHINIYNNKTTAGDITTIAVGLSTSATSQVGGFTANIMGHQTYTSATTDAIVSTISYTFSVPTATNYYLNQVATFTTMTLNSTTNSYIQYTRIA